MIKVDLHTHSEDSPDGGITKDQYKQAFDSGLLQCMAITDHNTIKNALKLHKEFGEKIIVGEEIMTTAGEIIGLYLKDKVTPHQSPMATISAIKDQGGLVYIPHPFETVRKGLPPQVLEEVIDHVDIIEICNGRALAQNRSAQAVVWSRLNQKTGAASSDAHGWHGLGRTYTLIQDMPSHDTLASLLIAGTPQTGPPSVRGLLYPKINRLRRKLKIKQ